MVVIPGTVIGFGIGIAIGIVHKVENVLFQRYMRIADPDSEPDTDSEEQRLSTAGRYD